jgi:two-component system OmpR family sensor kinase
MSAARGAKGWSIARQIGVLIFAALILLTAANFAVTFAGPPPREPPVQFTQLVPVLQGHAPERRPPGERLTVEAAATFAARSGERRRPDGEARLAQLLAVAPGQVRLTTAQPLFGRIPDALAGGFSLGLADGAGGWRIVRSAPQPLLTQWHWTTIAVTLGLTLLLGFIAARITMGITRPIRRLAQEADQAYLEGPAGAITIDGPPEIAHLAGTIAAMRDRFAAMVENRTMMLAAISHDMATPLARLQFHVAKLPASVRAQAEADLEELSALIASILGYAKGQQGLDRKPVALVALARDVVQRADRAEAPVTIAGDPAEIWIAGDRLALQRLIGNLVSNAQRYGGGGRVLIAPAPGAVSLIVEDDGPGFDPAMAERLFEPFFRIEASRSRETAGAGLGLATARAIAEAHGGTLTAASAAGAGARFVLTLPVVERVVGEV